jgi:DNA modification methylase
MRKKVIGSCTLYLGDCFEILPSLIGVEADMVFADPPYGMRKRGILNDNLNYDALLEFNKKWTLLSLDVLKNGGSWYCWGIEEPLMDIYSEILKSKIKNREITFRNLIIWDKGSGQGQRSQSHRSYVRCNENCLFITKGNRTIKKMSAKAHFLDELKYTRELLIAELKKAGINNEITQRITGQKYVYGHWIATASWRMIVEKNYNQLKNFCETNGINAFNKTYEEFRSEYIKALKEWQQNRTYFDNIHENMNCIWHFPHITPSESCRHPAQKPITVCKRAIKTSCPHGGIVVDPFMGSGSAGVACVELGRKFIGIEINEKYFDIACNRIKEAYNQLPLAEGY